MVYNVALVDDDESFLNQILGYVDRFSKEEEVVLNVRTFDSGVEFITNYHPEFDIIFMDIEMPGFSGMETARELREQDENVCLVFITNMAKYAIEGYSVSAMDFIVKPVDYFAFAVPLKRAMSKVKVKVNDKFIIREKGKSISVNIGDIVYVESDKHYLIYHIGHEEYRTRGTIGETEEFFAPHGFASCNSGCVVNLKYVTSFSGDTVELSVGGEKIKFPISRYRKKPFLTRLTEYLK